MPLPVIPFPTREFRPTTTIPSIPQSARINVSGGGGFDMPTRSRTMSMPSLESLLNELEKKKLEAQVPTGPFSGMSSDYRTSQLGTANGFTKESEENPFWARVLAGGLDVLPKIMTPLTIAQNAAYGSREAFFKNNPIGKLIDKTDGVVGKQAQHEDILGLIFGTSAPNVLYNSVKAIPDMLDEDKRNARHDADIMLLKSISKNTVRQDANSIESKMRESGKSGEDNAEVLRQIMKGWTGQDTEDFSERLTDYGWEKANSKNEDGSTNYLAVLNNIARGGATLVGNVATDPATPIAYGSGMAARASTKALSAAQIAAQGANEFAQEAAEQGVKNAAIGTEGILNELLQAAQEQSAARAGRGPAMKSSEEFIKLITDDAGKISDDAVKNLSDYVPEGVAQDIVDKYGRNMDDVARATAERAAATAKEVTVRDVFEKAGYDTVIDEKNLPGWKIREMNRVQPFLDDAWQSAYENPRSAMQIDKFARRLSKDYGIVGFEIPFASTPGAFAGAGARANFAQASEKIIGESATEWAVRLAKLRPNILRSKTAQRMVETGSRVGASSSMTAERLLEAGGAISEHVGKMDSAELLKVMDESLGKLNMKGWTKRGRAKNVREISMAIGAAKEMARRSKSLTDVDYFKNLVRSDIVEKFEESVTKRVSTTGPSKWASDFLPDQTFDTKDAAVAAARAEAEKLYTAGAVEEATVGAAKEATEEVPEQAAKKTRTRTAKPKEDSELAKATAAAKDKQAKELKKRYQSAIKRGKEMAKAGEDPASRQKALDDINAQYKAITGEDIEVRTRSSKPLEYSGENTDLYSAEEVITIGGKEEKVYNKRFIRTIGGEDNLTIVQGGRALGEENIKGKSGNRYRVFAANAGTRKKSNIIIIEKTTRNGNVTYIKAKPTKSGLQAALSESGVTTGFDDNMLRELADYAQVTSQADKRGLVGVAREVYESIMYPNRPRTNGYEDIASGTAERTVRNETNGYYRKASQSETMVAAEDVWKINTSNRGLKRGNFVAVTEGARYGDMALEESGDSLWYISRVRNTGKAIAYRLAPQEKMTARQTLKSLIDPSEGSVVELDFADITTMTDDLIKRQMADKLGAEEYARLGGAFSEVKFTPTITAKMEITATDGGYDMIPHSRVPGFEGEEAHYRIRNRGSHYTIVDKSGKSTVPVPGGEVSIEGESFPSLEDAFDAWNKREAEWIVTRNKKSEIQRAQRAFPIGAQKDRVGMRDELRKHAIDSVSGGFTVKPDLATPYEATGRQFAGTQKIVANEEGAPQIVESIPGGDVPGVIDYMYFENSGVMTKPGFVPEVVDGKVTGKAVPDSKEHSILLEEILGIRHDPNRRYNEQPNLNKIISESNTGIEDATGGTGPRQLTDVVDRPLSGEEVESLGSPASEADRLKNIRISQNAEQRIPDAEINKEITRLKKQIASAPKQILELDNTIKKLDADLVAAKGTPEEADIVRRLARAKQRKQTLVENLQNTQNELQDLALVHGDTVSSLKTLEGDRAIKDLMREEIGGKHSSNANRAAGFVAESGERVMALDPSGRVVFSWSGRIDENGEAIWDVLIPRTRVMTDRLGEAPVDNVLKLNTITKGGTNLVETGHTITGSMLRNMDTDDGYRAVIDSIFDNVPPAALPSHFRALGNAVDPTDAVKFAWRDNPQVVRFMSDAERSLRVQDQNFVDAASRTAPEAVEPTKPIAEVMPDWSSPAPLGEPRTSTLVDDLTQYASEEELPIVAEYEDAATQLIGLRSKYYKQRMIDMNLEDTPVGKSAAYGPDENEAAQRALEIVEKNEPKIKEIRERMAQAKIDSGEILAKETPDIGTKGGTAGKGVASELKPSKPLTKKQINARVNERAKKSVREVPGETTYTDVDEVVVGEKLKPFGEVPEKGKRSKGNWYQPVRQEDGTIKLYGNLMDGTRHKRSYIGKFDNEQAVLDWNNQLRKASGGKAEDIKTDYIDPERVADAIKQMKDAGYFSKDVDVALMTEISMQVIGMENEIYERMFEREAKRGGKGKWEPMYTPGLIPVKDKFTRGEKILYDVMGVKNIDNLKIDPKSLNNIQSINQGQNQLRKLLNEYDVGDIIEGHEMEKTAGNLVDRARFGFEGARQYPFEMDMVKRMKNRSSAGEMVAVQREVQDMFLHAFGKETPVVDGKVITGTTPTKTGKLLGVDVNTIGPITDNLIDSQGVRWQLKPEVKQVFNDIFINANEEAKGPGRLFTEFVMPGMTSGNPSFIGNNTLGNIDLAIRNGMLNVQDLFTQFKVIRFINGSIDDGEVIVNGNKVLLSQIAEDQLRRGAVSMAGMDPYEMITGGVRQTGLYNYPVIGRYFTAMRNANRFSEDSFRGAAYLNAVYRKGYDPDVAMKMVDDTLYDYSRAGLTRTEQKIRKYIPFYNWQRRNIPAQVKFAARRPALAYQMYYKAPMETSWDNEDLDRDFTINDTVDFWQQSLTSFDQQRGIPVVAGNTGADGETATAIFPKTTMGDLAPIGEALQEIIQQARGEDDNAGSAIRELLTGVMGPDIKMGIEAMTGKDSYGNPIEFGGNGVLGTGLGKDMPGVDVLNWLLTRTPGVSRFGNAILAENKFQDSNGVKGNPYAMENAKSGFLMSQLPQDKYQPVIDKGRMMGDSVEAEEKMKAAESESGVEIPQSEEDINTYLEIALTMQPMSAMQLATQGKIFQLLKNLDGYEPASQQEKDAIFDMKLDLYRQFYQQNRAEPTWKQTPQFPLRGGMGEGYGMGITPQYENLKNGVSFDPAEERMKTYQYMKWAQEQRGGY